METVKLKFTLFSPATQIAMAWMLESINVFLQLNENVSQTEMTYSHYLNRSKGMGKIYLGGDLIPLGTLKQSPRDGKKTMKFSIRNLVKKHTMSLAIVMVWILSNNDNFSLIKWHTRPRPNFVSRGKDLAFISFGFYKFAKL
jgi:hypothetical protein